MSRRKVILVQLPIPPVGPEPIRGNVPLAAAYLKMFARDRGSESHFEIDIFPPALANTLGDVALVEAIAKREPWLVGFTCYLWNIERTLWIAERIKQLRPEVRILIGGPEVTLDNAWVLEHPAVDYAAIGEGEQTFAELLSELAEKDEPSKPIAGLISLRLLSRKRVASDAAKIAFQPFTPSALQPFTPRQPLPNLNAISSPYLAGILDAADEQMLLLETIRGCIFKCNRTYAVP
ncbi:MAG TPA: cobalamin-dependent protein [Pirellulales bacterium]